MLLPHPMIREIRRAAGFAAHGWAPLDGAALDLHVPTPPEADPDVDPRIDPDAPPPDIDPDPFPDDPANLPGDPTEPPAGDPPSNPPPMRTECGH
ncbi:hypothetical protein [Paraburkholderia antibiotica]|nr:hypothetical protein [Paraburkholderia antibiotica]